MSAGSARAEPVAELASSPPHTHIIGAVASVGEDDDMGSANDGPGTRRAQISGMSVNFCKRPRSGPNYCVVISGPALAKVGQSFFRIQPDLRRGPSDFDTTTI